MLIQNKINNIRKQDIQNFNTNYFINKLARNVSVFENDKAILILCQDRDIYRLYFAYNDLFSFEKILRQIPQDIQICVEILVKHGMDEKIKNILCKYFTFDTIFQRLRCDVSKLKIFKIYNKIEYAINSDFDTINNALNNTFNHHSSHLPSQDELLSLIETKKVIVVRKNDEIVNFIVYKENNNNINFDQFISFDRKAIHTMKVLDYLYGIIKNKNYKTIYLWVDIINNLPVKKLHTFYGYSPDGLQNYIFINKALKDSIKK